MEKRRKSVNAAASSLYSAWPVSIDRRTFCFTPFALIRPSRREASTLPQPLRQPRSPFTLFLSEIRRAALSPLPPAFSTLRPPTDHPLLLLSRRSHLLHRLPSPPVYAFRPKGKENKERGKGKERKERRGDELVGEGRAGRFGGGGFYLLSFSLSRVLIAYRLDLNGASSRIFTIFSLQLQEEGNYIYKFI